MGAISANVTHHPLSGVQAEAAATTGVAEEVFVPLLNGRDLSGWNTTGNWIVEEGGVVALHPRPGEHGWTRYGAYLTTARKYKDFILPLVFTKRLCDVFDNDSAARR